LIEALARGIFAQQTMKPSSPTTAPQVAYSDAPILIQPDHAGLQLDTTQHAPELDDRSRLPPNVSEKAGRSTAAEAGSHSTKRRVCGLPRTAFWLVIVIAFFALGAGIGGGIGGALANKRSFSSKAEASTSTR